MQKKVHKKRKIDSNSSSDDSRELLKSIISFMKQNQELSLTELINIYSDISPEESIPISIFSTRLSPSEALCLFLKDNRNLSFHDIALLLNRDDRSIWTSCERAKRKSPKPLRIKEDDVMVPIISFTDRSLSILEHIVHHLKTAHSMTNSQIADALNKNPSSIATVANRASKKREAARPK